MSERFRWDHPKSQEWRRKLRNIIENELGLDPEILATWGVIKRIYDGQLLYENKATSIEWMPKGQDLTHPRYNDLPVVVNVKSQGRKLVDTYTLKVMLSLLSDEEKLIDPFLSREDRRRLIYVIKEVTDHDCRDELYNVNLKKIPTICKHKVAAVFDVQERISRSIEEERLQDEVTLFRTYNPLPQEFKDYYESLPTSMSSLDKTRVLYRFLKGEIPVFEV